MSLDVPTRFEEALGALHAAETRQLAHPKTRRLAGEPRRRLLHELLRQVIEIHELADSASDVQRSLLEEHCADTSILLALIAAQPRTHA